MSSQGAPPKCDVDGCREFAEALVSWDGGSAYRCGIHVEEWPGDVEWITEEPR